MVGFHSRSSLKKNLKNKWIQMFYDHVVNEKIFLFSHYTFHIIPAVKLLTTPIWKSDLTIHRENVTTAFLDECFVLYNFWTFDPVLEFTFWMSHSKSIYHLWALIMPIYFRAQNYAPRRNLIVGNVQILAEILSLKGVLSQTPGSVKKFNFRQIFWLLKTKVSSPIFSIRKLCQNESKRFTQIKKMGESIKEPWYLWRHLHIEYVRVL